MEHYVVSIILGLHQLCLPAMAKNQTSKGFNYSGKKKRKKQYINNTGSPVSASCTLLMRVKNITWCKMSTHLLPPTLLYLEHGLRKS